WALSKPQFKNTHKLILTPVFPFTEGTRVAPPEQLKFKNKLYDHILYIWSGHIHHKFIHMRRKTVPVFVIAACTQHQSLPLTGTFS
ncbi:hypothetical protein ACJX0J_023234, partial [Zea mays]